MNSFIFAIAAAVFSTIIKSGVAQTCTFCSGVTLDESFEIPESEGTTCGLVVTTAAMFEEGADDCTGLQMLERYCCPSGNEGASCSFCEGVDELGYTVISQGVTCRDAAMIVPMIAGDSAECTNFKMLETICCPSLATPPESPCNFCAGLDVLENVSHEGVSCETAAAVAGALESTSLECSLSLAYQAICCPVTPTVACSFCDGATTMTSGTAVLDTLTCEEVADYAAWLESTADECPTVQEAEAMCCPDTIASPNTTSNKPSNSSPVSRPPTLSNAPSRAPAVPSTASPATALTLSIPTR